jgi:hypothetical protein
MPENAEQAREYREGKEGYPLPPEQKVRGSNPLGRTTLLFVKSAI